MLMTPRSRALNIYNKLRFSWMVGGEINTFKALTVDVLLAGHHAAWRKAIVVAIRYSRLIEQLP